MDFSIIHYYGDNSSRCGYCKGTTCSISHGMHAYTMSPQDYQALIDRGWRRSGQYCYKPDNQITCCPCYTIKCDALEFKLSKSHKKILKRMTRFLRDGKKEPSDAVNIPNSSVTGTKLEDSENRDDIQAEQKAPDVPLPKIDLEAVTAANTKRNHIAKELNKKYYDNLNPKTQSEASTSQNLGKKSNCDTPSLNPPCKKAKQMRLERRQAKLIAKGLNEPASVPSTTNTQSAKTLTDFITDVSPNDKHKLKIVLVPSRPLKVESHVHSLYRKYQIAIHNDTPDSVTPKSLDRFLYKSPLKYQKLEGGPPEGYGSFHQQYWLDEKLIAVAVIDVLPYCVSSVYFFYDPDYSFLSLGTYASLREIEFVQQLAKVAPALKYYYMGYYIHSCPKMRYKGKLVPSELLCSETYTWHLLTDETRKQLDERKYLRFNTDANAKDRDDFNEDDLNDVLLLLENDICTTYSEYTESFQKRTLNGILDFIRGRINKKVKGSHENPNLIIEYGKLVGRRCAHRMLYINF